MGQPSRTPTPATVPAGRQLLTYAPEGPLGGTFTCTQCGARGWQPDLLDHTPDCVYRAPAVPRTSAPDGMDDGAVTPRR